jgi:hypothetical protein
MTYRLQSIRKTVVAFASLFKDIPLIKYDENGKEVERIIVPIIYGDKEKYVKRLDISHEKVQITLPRIEYGLITIEYDSDRKLNPANKLMGCTGTGNLYVNSPIPYNFNLELVLYTRNIEDANQITEYILSHFQPDYNMRVVMIPEAGIIKTIPITFNGDSVEEDSTGSFDSPVRSVFRTLTFTARSFIFQPPKEYIPILEANTTISISQNNGNAGSYTYYNLKLINGVGNFIGGENVYQGYNYDTASAKATVASWDKLTKILSVDNVIGDFTVNSILRNVSGSAEYLIGTLPTAGLAYATSETPTSNTFPPTGPYGINITYVDNTV